MAQGRLLFIGTQCATDSAKHLIAEKGREKLVSTFVENWQILDENSWKLSVSSDRNRNATGYVEAT